MLDSAMSGSDREPIQPAAVPEDTAGSPAGAAAGEGEKPRGVLYVIRRTAVKAWDDSIFGQSAEAAFWQTLSLPPLLLGLLGSLGYIAGWFGSETAQQVESKIVGFCRRVFDPSIVEQIIAPTVQDILNHGRAEIVSIGFILSLWAGSSAMACFVDAITLAHGQFHVRNEVWQRIFSLLLYVAALVVGIFTLPLLALGPDLLARLSPLAWEPTVAAFIERFYYPGVGVLLVLALTTLYKLALPHKLPWHRLLPGALLAMVAFLTTSAGLRFYIGWVTSTGYTYGALATPIAFLLFAFFIGLAIILGAQLNHAIEEAWPAHMTHREGRRWGRLAMERAARRLRSSSPDAPARPVPQATQAAAADPGEHTAPSPADTTATTPLPVADNGGRTGRIARPV
jgi:membrane protein